MYGLPEDFDASVFLGKRVDQICFSENTINFSFEDNLSITIMGSFIHIENQSVTANKQSVPVSSSNLMSIIGKVVSRAEGLKEGTLILHFENDHSLTLLDDSQEYESYIIRIGNKEIFV